MNYNSSKRTKNIPLELSDGSSIYIEVTQIGDRPVSSKNIKLKEITNYISDIGKELGESVKNISKNLQPDEITLEIGMEVAAEAGELTAIIVKGSSKANFKISMKWNTHDR